jgi:hypothetical protein
VVNLRVGELVSLSFEEENALCPKERMNRAEVLGDFFLKNDAGIAPRGTLDQRSKGRGAFPAVGNYSRCCCCNINVSCFGEAPMRPLVRPDPGATVQMERCEKLVMTTLVRWLRRWLLLGARQASPATWVEGLG